MLAQPDGAGADAATPHVKIVVPAGTRPEITLDDQALAEEAWGRVLPVDRGYHQVVATEAGKRSFSVRFNLSEEGATRVVLVPSLPPTTLVTRSPPDLTGTSTPITDSQQGWKRVESAGAAMVWVGLLATLPGVVLLGVTAESHPTPGALVAATSGGFAAPSSSRFRAWSCTRRRASTPW